MSRAMFSKGEKIARIERRLGDPRRALKQIGVLMVAESQQAFRAQQFGPHHWPARAPINLFGILSDFQKGRSKPLPRRFERRPALQDTGRLAASIAHRVISRKVVEVGTNLRYAAVHQKGGKTKSAKLTSAIRQAFHRWLRKESVSLQRQLGWVLNKKFKGKRLEHKVPERPFVGVNKRTIREIKRSINITIMEAK